MGTSIRRDFAQAPIEVRAALLDALTARGYEVALTSDWQVTAQRGSVGRNVLLGGFGQRMDLRFDLYAGPDGGTVLDAGVRDQTSSAVMGGMIGMAKTESELAAICADIAQRL